MTWYTRRVLEFRTVASPPKTARVMQGVRSFDILYSNAMKQVDPERLGVVLWRNTKLNLNSTPRKIGSFSHTLAAVCVCVCVCVSGARLARGSPAAFALVNMA